MVSQASAMWTVVGDYVNKRTQLREDRSAMNHALRWVCGREFMRAHHLRPIPANVIDPLCHACCHECSLAIKADVKSGMIGETNAKEMQMMVSEFQVPFKNISTAHEDITRT